MRYLLLFLNLCVLCLTPVSGQQTDKPAPRTYKPTRQVERPMPQIANYDSVSRVNTGTPVSVMLTAYSTTLRVNTRTRLRIAVADEQGREITTAEDSIRLYVTGDGKVMGTRTNPVEIYTDSAGVQYAGCKLQNGLCFLNFVAGSEPDKVKVEARSGTLWAGSHEIHTLPADFEMKTPDAGQAVRTMPLRIGKMIGADISWLPQLEDEHKSFIENGNAVDAITLLKEHGFNAIRLRIFVDPQNEKGYSPEKGYCGLSSTLKMAQRVKDAGMQLLLDFHYSDYWADPQQQNKPLRWSQLKFSELKDSVQAYTTHVLKVMEEQGTPPDMVQIGNEINHGLLWPEGHISNPDQLAELLKAGAAGAKAAIPSIPVMMHIALGGQSEEAVFWLDNMIARGVMFDVIGLSYYPRWHGTLEDLQSNVINLARRYRKPLNIVEYSNYKKEVHDIIFGLPGSMGTGACIWEPLNWRSGLFTREGAVTEMMGVYDALSEKYLR